MKAALASALLLGAWLATGGARAEGSTPGYPERVLQWTVQKGETCADIAKAMYGKSAHERLLARYNAIKCRSGKTLAEGTTLVVPEKVSEPPTAQLQTVNPAVRTRSPGGAWTPAGPGMSLGDRYSVNTLEKAAADIHFVDRTRVYLGEHTLVVIYDTASRSRIAKVNPADVKLDQGELQAGLAALRGGTVDIEVEGGGLVSAQSRNTVVKRRGKTTTVAVFDGSAKVASGGQEIAVPVDHGTSFTDEKPPAPPRPLPPAPAWETGTARGFALAPEAGGLIQAAWSAVPQAVAYRFEVARDPEFSRVVVREEVPARIRSFRAEQMPAGSYHLRVRAIDAEDYLGRPAAPRGLTVVQARFDPAGAGRVEGGELRASRYAWLLLEASPATELGLDAGPFGPVPERIELARRAPREVRVRERGNEEALAWPLRYDEASASIALVPGPPGSGEGTVRVALDGLGGVDPARVGARLRVHLRGGVAEGALRARAGDPANLSAVVVLGDRAGTVRFDVVDGRGRVLGSELLDWRPVPKERPAPPRPPGPPPGVLAAPVAQSPALSVPWWAPSAPQGGALVLGADSVASGAAAQLRAHLVGVIEPLAVEARLGTNALGEPRPTDAGAWLGARWRAFELGRPLELGPALRLGLPTSSTSAPARLELGGAAGGSHGRWTWLGDVGARFALQDDARRTAVPDGQAFIVLGGTYQAARWLRAYSLLDLHAMTYPGDDVAAVRGGLGLGLETATTVFGDLGLRLTPWEDLGGHVYGQIAVGIRSE